MDGVISAIDASYIFFRQTASDLPRGDQLILRLALFNVGLVF